MADFLIAMVDASGTAFGCYPDGRLITCPRWISPSGDVLLALLALRPYREIPEETLRYLVDMLLAGQMANGGIQTAYGLLHKGDTRPYRGLPDFRDVLPVVGWVDKAFHALAERVPTGSRLSGLSQGRSDLAKVNCSWKGQPCRYEEDTEQIRLTVARSGDVVYQWRKGENYPEVYRL
jgi:hypothetical protein